MKKKNMNTGINLKNMDLTVNPGDNFYDFATLGWRKTHPIPDDCSSYYIFDELEENVIMKRLCDIIKNDKGKIGTLYKLAMDIRRLNREKTAPVQPFFMKIDAIKSKKDLPMHLGYLQKIVSAFWKDEIDLDAKDSKHFLYGIAQDGLGLPRNYYFDKDKKTLEIQKKYKKYLADIMKNFGLKIDTEQLYNFEKNLARSFYSGEKLRVAEENYHKMSLKKVRQNFPGFDWDTYLSAHCAGTVKFINMCQPEAIKGAIKIINDADLNLIKDYLKYRIISAAWKYLDDKTYKIGFDFYEKTMLGQKAPKPRWRRAITLLDWSLGEELGRKYIKNFFQRKTKKRVEKMLKNIKKALALRIKNLDWMSKKTKKNALVKLKNTGAKIGYPDKWRNYDKLEISEKDSLWKNVARCLQFKSDFKIGKIGKKDDKNYWSMNAYEANAYHDSNRNEVVFPAGYLQPPFFDINADDAYNYGSLSFLGHETMHGFDNHGRKFDSKGNMKDWWTKDDAEKFKKKAKVMRDYFDKITIAPGVHANGELTLGENLADYGDLLVTYDAFQKYGKHQGTIKGLTDEQRFFIAYAMGNAANIRKEAEIAGTKTGEHSLPMWRVNGILPHIDAWYRAFNVTPKNKMYIDLKKRTKLW